MILVTRELLEQGKSKSGGWNAEQLKLLGIAWPPPEDWRSYVVGREIDPVKASAFVKMRNLRQHSKTLKKAKVPRYVGMSDGQAIWAKKNRRRLVRKDNRAEERIDAVLRSLPVMVSRERPIAVNGKIYFVDFLVTSIKPRKKVRVAIEIDGRQHDEQQDYDRQREADLLSTCRVWSVVRMGWPVAMRITGPELLAAIEGVRRGEVRIL